MSYIILGHSKEKVSDDEEKYSLVRYSRLLLAVPAHRRTLLLKRYNRQPERYFLSLPNMLFKVKYYENLEAKKHRNKFVSLSAGYFFCSPKRLNHKSEVMAPAHFNIINTPYGICLGRNLGATPTVELMISALLAKYYTSAFEDNEVFPISPLWEEWQTKTRATSKWVPTLNWFSCRKQIDYHLFGNKWGFHLAGKNQEVTL